MLSLTQKLGKRGRFAKVSEQIDRAPESLALFSRDGKNDLDLKGHRVYLGTGGAAIKILDLETGKVRPTKLKDIYQIGRLVDQLENIHFFLRLCIPTDIPKAAYDVNSFYAGLNGTEKHVMAGVIRSAEFDFVLQLSFFRNMVSPQQKWPEKQVSQHQEYQKW